MPVVGTLYLSGCNYQFGWDLVSQDVASNSSTVSFYGILNVTNNYVSWSSGTASIHTASAGLSTYYSKGSYVVVQSYFTFPHNADGNLTLSAGYAIDTTMPGGSGNGYVTITLPKINRIAITNSLISQSNINNVEEWFKITYTKYVDNYTYKLRVSIPRVVELEKVDYNTSGAEYTMSDTALNKLLGINPNTGKPYIMGNSVDLGFAVETWNGGTILSGGNELVVKGKLLDANPVFIDYDIEEVNDTVKSLTGSTKNNVININGYSNIKATVITDNKATAVKNATMNKYRFAIDGNNPVDITYSDNQDVSGTIDGAVTGVYKLYAIDNRDNSTLVTKQASTIKDYSKIALNKQGCTVKRDDNEVGENAILTLQGTFWNDNFGITNNDITITYRYRKSDSSTWTTGATTITPTKSNNSFSFSGNIAGDNNSKWNLGDSYVIEITAADELSTDTMELILNSAVPTLSLDKNGVGVLCKYDTNIGGVLQVDGKVIDGGTIVWTNSSPTSNFASQTITLDESLDNYDCYEILFRQSTNATATRIMTTGKIPVGYGTILNSFSGRYRPTGTTVSGNTIYFENAVNSGGTNNGETIPLYVIGYKTNLFD